MHRLLLACLALSNLLGCNAEEEEKGASVDLSCEAIGAYDYSGRPFPKHFKEEGSLGGPAVLDTDNTPADNKITDAGAGLGRVLFYDTNLSANGTVACASCHKAELGFSDDAVLSEGFDGGSTRRHSMGLTNARFYENGRFFWDQRAETLEDQVLMPFQDPVEMGMTLDEVVAAVEGQDFYPPLFQCAFGDSEVTSDRISKALAQFVRSIVSYGSKYDEGRAQVSSSLDEFPNFTEQENLGRQIFMNTPMGPNGAGCAVCHQGESMAMLEPNNNGLDSDTSEDEGYGEVTGDSFDLGTFKAPSLRNIAVRRGFMHDGRFTTLRQVVDHYADTVEPHPNMGPPLSMHDLNFSEDERKALVAFMKTLTDEQMLADPKYADPFAQ